MNGPRQLPSVRALLEWPGLAETLASRGHQATLRSVRAAIDEARRGLVDRLELEVDVEILGHRALALIALDRPTLRPVINATGILLNTGLGRAPLAIEAADAVGRVVKGYCNLEFDLDRGDRGRRTDGIESLLRRLTGFEAAAVVNNNAAATVIAVRALAIGKEVIVSRGQLVEIGGSFRLPEIIEVSGARLREVGTTNKTRLSDYERAIGPETAAILRVHPSNYRVVGFTEDVPIADLAALARNRGLWSIDDIGSGALGPGMPPRVRGEPTAVEGREAGADLVLFSGDKLLGGPQCGILLGSRGAIDRVSRDPMMRALRVDKMTIAALEATLRLLLDPAIARSRIPLWSLLDVATDRLVERAEAMAGRFRAELGLSATAEQSTAFLGGGSSPVEPIPTAVIRVGPPFPPRHPSEAAWARALRMGEPAVVPRVRGGSVLFDLRGIAEADDPELVRMVVESCQRDPSIV